mgnify:CR=1 FL=1
MITTYLRLIWAYLQIGLFGFGGGYAMLSLIQGLVGGKDWCPQITTQTFTDIVAISQMTPGPIGINSATYIGYVATGSVLGAIVATFTVVLPPFILVLYASHFIARHQESAIIKGSFMELRPVVVGLIASAALLLMNKENFGDTSIDVAKSVAICLASLGTVYFTKIHPILVIVVAGIIGYFIF